MSEQNEYSKAKAFLERALLTPARQGREDADQGRREEVKAALEKITATLQWRPIH